MSTYSDLASSPFGSATGGTNVQSSVSFTWRPDLNTTTLPTYATAGKKINSRIDVLDTLQVSSYILFTGPASLVNDVTPNDYNASTNNVHWEYKSVVSTGENPLLDVVTGIDGGTTGLVFSGPDNFGILTVLGGVEWDTLRKEGSDLVDLETREWYAITDKPTTLSGYGITDGQPLNSDLTSITNLSVTNFGLQLLTKADGAAVVSYIGAGSGSFTGSFDDLTDVPTTLSGYGISDAQPLDADLTAIAALSTTSFGRVLLTKADAAAVLSYIGAGAGGFSGLFADLSGKPTTLSGYGITDAQPVDADLTAIAALATDSFGRGILTRTSASTTRTYIGAGTSSFDGVFASLTSKPTTLAGYGIVDGQPLDADLTSIAALTTLSFGRGLLALNDAAAVRSYIGAGSTAFTGAWSEITGTPTTLAGYGITNAQPIDSDLTSIAALSTTSFGRGALTQADAATFRSYIGAGANSFSGSFTDLSNKPTTVSGYGITDALTPTNSATVTNKTIAVDQLTGVLARARLGSGGTGGGNLFLADDQTFKSTAGTLVFQAFGNSITGTINAGTTVALVSTVLTSPYTLTLPLASAYTNGKTIAIYDSPVCTSSVNTLSVQRSGSNLINGSTSPFVIADGNPTYAIFVSDGVSNWTVTAASKVLPDQNGHAGEVLTTDGTDTSWDVPTNNSLVNYDEVFDFGSGLSNWTAGGGTGAVRVAEASHVGIIRVDTSATITTLTYFRMSTVGVFLATELFDMTFVVRLNNNDSNTTVRVGLSSDPTSQTPTSGIYFEKLAADTAWFRVARDTTQSRNSTSISTSTAWVKLRMRAIDAATLGYTINAGTEQTLTSNIPTGGVIPFIQLYNANAASKTMDVDYCRLNVTSITR